MATANKPLHIAVYCSAADNLPDLWRHTAARLGQWIGLNNATLVYGGVDAGLMSVVAEAADKAGAKIVGVVPTRRLSCASPLNGLQIPVADLNDRKATMQLLSDIFVILPGGYGTVDELMSAFAYLNFTAQTKKHIIVYNPDGLFDKLIAQFDTFIRLGLMNRQCLTHLTVAADADSLVAELDRALINYNAS